MLTWKKVLGRLALGSVAFLGVAGLGLAAWNRSWEMRWERRLAELRTFSEPARARRAARSPEAHALEARLRTIVTSLDGLLPSEEEIERDFGGWDLAEGTLEEGRIAAMRRALEAAAQPLAEWRQLRTQSEFQAALARQETLGAIDFKLMESRRFVNALVWQATLEALNADGSVASAETLASIFDFARAYDGGTLLHAVIRSSLECIGLAEMRELLERGLIAPAVLRATFDPRLEMPWGSSPPCDSLQAEVATFLDRCEDIEEVVATPFASWFDRTASERATLLAGFDGVEELSTWGFLSPCEYLVRAPTENTATSYLAPSFFSLLSLRHRFASQSSLARIALAIEAHRAEHGALPASLDELASAFPRGVPLDPLTGEPFRYESNGAQARLGPSAWIQREPVAWDVACQRLLAWEF